jgi:hypothetical protein
VPVIVGSADECGECGGDGPEENFDCDGNCIVDTDCAGDCGGSAVEDECGDCGGDGADVMCDDGSYVSDADDCSDDSGWDGDACSMPANSLHVTAEGDVLFNANVDIAGFQFNVDGATVSGASGGAAADAGFTVSAGGVVVLGFSFTGATVPAGCGTLTSLALDGEPSGLSTIVISNSAGESVPFTYFDGTEPDPCDMSINNLYLNGAYPPD